MHSSSGRGSRWLSWAGGLLAIGTMLILSLVLRVQGNEDKAKPIARAVAARLATDEGARDLYAKNPGLKDTYASADAFVAAVSAKRAAFGTPPAPGATGGYEVDSDPLGVRVFVKGSGGAWMALQVERSDGTEAGHAAIGEGITFLGFADSQSSAHELREAAERADREAQWAKFKAAAGALLTEDGTRQLLADNPGLAKDDAGRETFLHAFQAARPALQVERFSSTWKEAEDSNDTLVRMSRRQALGLGDQVAIGWRLKDGRWLRMAWDSGKLSKVAVEN